MRQIKTGDKFNLCGLEWEVVIVHCNWFKATLPTKENVSRSIDLHIQDADLLDWIKPKLTIPKKTKKALQFSIITDNNYADLIALINSLEETE